jgi:hypothetical protein
LIRFAEAHDSESNLHTLAVENLVALEK